AHQTQLQLQSTLIQTQHQVHETRFHMQQTELATLRETDRRRQDQMVETLRVIRDMRREMSDMQAELLALREQRRIARQSGPEARVPEHQEASGDADIPYNGQAVFTNEWDLASLEYSQETKGQYCTDLPTLDDIRRLLKLERVMVDRTIKSQTVSFNPNQILTKELSPNMKQWEELIRENVFGLGGHRDCLPACLAHMLYCVVAEEQYNLAYFFVKRIECTSSHQHEDDDDDVQTSRAITLSPTTYLNSLNPLNYQNYQMPSSSEQTDETLFERQTTLLNQTQQMHKEIREGFKSFGKALKGVFSKKKK
ncbi:hypothetical protein Tco_0582721, partial [Tanacetum coccineum]